MKDPSKQDSAIEYLRHNRISDVLFFHPPHGEGKFQTYYVNSVGKVEDVDLGYSSLNILQIAVLLRREALVQYILNEHKYVSTVNRQVKTVDPRVVLASIEGFDNELATVTLALQTQSKRMIQLIWDQNIDLYTQEHAKQFSTIVKHFCLADQQELLSETSTYGILMRASKDEEWQEQQVEAASSIFSHIKDSEEGKLGNSVSQHYGSHALTALRWIGNQD